MTIDTEFVWKMFIEINAEVVTLFIYKLNTTKSFKFKNIQYNITISIKSDQRGVNKTYIKNAMSYKS